MDIGRCTITFFYGYLPSSSPDTDKEEKQPDQQHSKTVPYAH